MTSGMKNRVVGIGIMGGLLSRAAAVTASTAAGMSHLAMASERECNVEHRESL